MNPRGHMQPYMNNSLAIRQEIQRFESVHPSIYAIYDLIEAIPDPLIQQQIREHVVCIEDSFVNSQEWTLSRSVPDLKLGILGSINSGKSALVHRYLTGSYMQEESPEGGRFKKEVAIDGQSYLLLIRDEGGPPEMQFTHWVDAVIFVFSLENEMSFNAIYSYYAKMAHYRNTSELPLILVGTQDAISESNPRVIDDARARKLANDLKRCSYYETCATYGLNVERVFQDACQKIIQLRGTSLTPNNSRPSTPNHSTMRNFYPGTATGIKPPSYDSNSTSSQSTSGSGHLPTATPSNSSHNIQGHSPPFKDGKDHKSDKKYKDGSDPSGKFYKDGTVTGGRGAVPVACPLPPNVPPPPLEHLPHASQGAAILYRAANQNGDELPTPTSTPILSRKNKNKSIASQQQDRSDRDSRDSSGYPQGPLTPILNRIPRVRSSLVLKKGDDDKLLGSGRAIPIKQGYLYKKSSKPLNKEWKKKYVTLTDHGILTYHSSIHDYMDDVHGKDINLLRTTVKIPGGRPRGSQPAKITTNDELNVPGLEMEGGAMVIPNACLAIGFAGVDWPHKYDGHIGGSPNSKIETPNVKKRHKRAKSGTNKNVDDGDSDGYEFVIVSIENKQWLFEAQTVEERDEWVTSIEQQILSSLQGNESTKQKSRNNTVTDPAATQLIRSVKGNQICADCDAPTPDWASLNLGALICIECSGIHRNLGTHLSRVRSLDLDEWPGDLVQVMTSIGNTLANSVWEANTKGRPKPSPQSSREEKEQWIRAKYDQREFLPPPPYLDVPLSQQLIDAVARQDTHNAILVLGYTKSEHVNTPYSKTDTRTALHIASALGNVVLVQLLLWYGAEAKMVDHEGRNALWYARSSGNGQCVELLRSQGVPENPTLPRRRGSSNQQSNQNNNAPDPFDKMPPNII